MLSKKWIFVTASLITFITTISTAIESIQVTRAIKVSGGEYHSLFLIEDKSVWGCGNNNFYQLGIGDNQTDRLMLIRTHDGTMNTPSDYLEDINDIAAGFKHSLALDVDGFVWAWGNNLRGQPQKFPHFGIFYRFRENYGNT
jgi:alpha-tubulin suppressor-like RCC1 family protein